MVDTVQIILKVQLLPPSANASDIRNFFKGLSIPPGGVYIVGGVAGLAFVKFSTDDDARQAMLLSGGAIKEGQLVLKLSSQYEMYRLVHAACGQASLRTDLRTIPSSP